MLSVVTFSINSFAQNHNVTLNVELSINVASLGNAEVTILANPAYLIPLQNSSRTYTLEVGNSKDFGVRVLDEMFNPVTDPDVLDAVQVTNCPDKYVVDEKGEVWCRFQATSDGDYTIEFSYGSESVKYDVSVVSPSTGTGGGGSFNVSWYNCSENPEQCDDSSVSSISDPYNMNVSKKNEMQTLCVKVIYQSTYVEPLRRVFSW